MEIKYPRLIVPGDWITDPDRITAFCTRAETWDPKARDTLFARHVAAMDFELVSGVVAVYEDIEESGEIFRHNVIRTPDVVVTWGTKEDITSVYNYIVRLPNSKSILIQLLTSSELKTVLKSLKLTTINSESRKQLKERKRYLVGVHQLFLAEYFKNRRD